MFESSVTYEENGTIESAWIKEMEFHVHDESGEEYDRSIISFMFNQFHENLVTMHVDEAYDPGYPAVIWLNESQIRMMADVLLEMADVLAKKNNIS